VLLSNFQSAIISIVHGFYARYIFSHPALSVSTSRRFCLPSSNVSPGHTFLIDCERQMGFSRPSSWTSNSPLDDDATHPPPAIRVSLGIPPLEFPVQSLPRSGSSCSRPTRPCSGETHRDLHAPDESPNLRSSHDPKNALRSHHSTSNWSQRGDHGDCHKNRTHRHPALESVGSPSIPRGSRRRGGPGKPGRSSKEHTLNKT